MPEQNLEELEHNEEGIIVPKRRSGEPEISPDALMVMIPSELSYLIRTTGAKETSLEEIAIRSLYLAHDRTPNPWLTFCGPFLGAPQAVIVLEKLIVLGAQRIWLLGYCGSLDPGLPIGRVLIPTRAVSEEGTSRHYPIGEHPLTSDEASNHLLANFLTRNGVPFEKGTVWTTDAPYRETPSKVKAFRQKGVLAVDMEMSAMMTLAIYRGVSLAGLLIVSDELFDLKWRPGFSTQVLRDSARLATNALLDAVRSLARGKASCR